MTTEQAHTDVMPRVFQANLSRLFDRVISPGMDALPVHTTLEIGETDDLDVFLQRAADQVDNYTANQAGKAFALTLAGLFERQLSIWARAVCAGQPDRISKRAGYEILLDLCAEHAGIDLDAETICLDLRQLLLVANVVRHGEGVSCDKLYATAPHLWGTNKGDYFDLVPGPSRTSEQLRIRKLDLTRYIYAATRFWGLADTLAMADVDPPYRDF